MPPAQSILPSNDRWWGGIFLCLCVLLIVVAIMKLRQPAAILPPPHPPIQPLAFSPFQRSAIPPPPPPPFQPSAFSPLQPPPLPPPPFQPSDTSSDSRGLTLWNALNPLWDCNFEINVPDATLSLSPTQCDLFKDLFKGPGYESCTMGMKTDVLAFASALYDAKKNVDDKTLIGQLYAKVLDGILKEASCYCARSKDSVSLTAYWKFKLVTYLDKSVCLSTKENIYNGQLVRAKATFSYAITVRISEGEDGEDSEVTMILTSLADRTVTIVPEGPDEKISSVL